MSCQQPGGVSGLAVCSEQSGDSGQQSGGVSGRQSGGSGELTSDGQPGHMRRSGGDGIEQSGHM